MPELTCHCGAVRIDVAQAPAEVTDCNCSICRRTGVLWAYYPIADVTFSPLAPATDVYLWGKKAIAFHRCKTCGCLTHGSPTDSSQTEMGLNARLLDPAVLSNARVRRFDGAQTWKYLDE